MNEEQCRCNLESCPDYMIRPACFNRAYSLCENYQNEKMVNDFLDNFRREQGFYVEEQIKRERDDYD